MADFCQQCSIEIFGEDMKDLASLTETTTYALCEGCGMVKINSDGKCIDSECPIHGDDVDEV